MIQVRVGDQLLEILSGAYRANRPALLVGRTGIGKSEIMEQMKQKLGIEVIVRDLSLMEAPELTGLPERKNGTVEYAKPKWLPTEGLGLLVFEEFNRAHRQTRTPCLQLLTARRLNDYILPEGWLPMAAINPPDDNDDYDVDHLDPAMMARFCVINVAPDIRNWLKWAEKNQVHQAVRGFVGNAPKAFEAPGCNPRSWKYVSDWMRAHESNPLGKQTLLAALSGHVGDSMARAFLKVYRDPNTGKIPEARRLLKQYSKCRAMVRNWLGAGQTDRLNAVQHEIMLFIQAPSGLHELQESALMRKNLESLAGDLPPDLGEPLKRLLGKFLKHQNPSKRNGQ